MNRDIVFRGKRTDNGEWVYGYYVVQNGVHQIYFDVPGSEWNMWEVDPATVGQKTGEKDINGNDYYEGDIGDDGSKNGRFTVLWSECECGFVAHYTFIRTYEGKSFGDWSEVPLTSRSDSSTIIGTIHDAPSGEKGEADHG